ncbi:glycosyltransferase family protein [Geovibrio ferrireducens]|uniref:hypothetical protein n=1 Tax=Geovibrio ferrireducens TaxID=46201 RepID=UPI0022468C70|nr:hypothetical protein [Geovibrio ferrireducens]
MTKTKYIYYFRGDLRSHVGIYKSWVDAAVSKGLDMQMVTFLGLKQYISQRKLIKRYSDENIKIYIGLPSVLNALAEALYFSALCLKYENVKVHVRKRKTNVLDFLKKLFPTKLKYIFEIEGDAVSEAEFLKERPSPECNYEAFIASSDTEKEKQYDSLKKSDGVLVVTELFKKVLIERYPELNLHTKINVIPTGVDAALFFYDKSIRDEYRKKLGIDDRFVLTFAGNIFYSWQNIKRSLDIFNLIKNKKLFPNPFFLLLIRAQDIPLAKKFIEQAGLGETDYLLTNVPHKEVNAYFNAADMGILLRDPHLMNEVACPGKVGEYLCSGLRVIITEKIGLYGEKVKAAEMGIVLSDFRDDTIVLEELIKSKEKTIEREKISAWAKNEFSVQSYADKYANILSGC